MSGEMAVNEASIVKQHWGRMKEGKLMVWFATERG